MKRLIIILLLSATTAFSKAQSHEVQQLLLNVEKLSQLKNILADMKAGYQIVSTGYHAVKTISEGNFTLHEVFLDGMMLVKPEIKKYSRVADIITYQKEIVTVYKQAFNRFKASGDFNAREMDYLAKVYQQLSEQSLNNLEELVSVITSTKLRMSDDERLQAIDRIFADSQDKVQFLRNFNEQAGMLSLRRAKERAEVQTLKKIILP